MATMRKNHKIGWSPMPSTASDGGRCFLMIIPCRPRDDASWEEFPPLKRCGKARIGPREETFVEKSEHQNTYRNHTGDCSSHPSPTLVDIYVIIPVWRGRQCQGQSHHCTMGEGKFFFPFLSPREVGSLPGEGTHWILSSKSKWIFEKQCSTLQGGQVDLYGFPCESTLLAEKKMTIPKIA